MLGMQSLALIVYPVRDLYYWPTSGTRNKKSNTEAQQWRRDVTNHRVVSKSDKQSHTSQHFGAIVNSLLSTERNPALNSNLLNARHANCCIYRHLFI